MEQQSIRVRPVAGALGAEITGVALSGELTGSTIGELRQALLEHLVLFFRDQQLTPESLLALARHFGEPVEYPFLRGVDGYPEVVEVIKRRHEKVNFGGVWHSDTTYLECPPMGTLLYALDVPPAGGDTLFSNMYLAYEGLSQGMRRLLAPLRAVNTAGKSVAAATRADRVEEKGKGQNEETVSAVHPVVRAHPETGRKSLFVNVAHTSRFEEMSQEESAPLLSYLWEWQIRPELTCRFQWRAGSLAFWDNRCTLHFPINDYDGHRRVMHRVSLAGERPR